MNIIIPITHIESKTKAALWLNHLIKIGFNTKNKTTLIFDAKSENTEEIKNLAKKIFSKIEFDYALNPFASKFLFYNWAFYNAIKKYSFNKQFLFCDLTYVPVNKDFLDILSDEWEIHNANHPFLGAKISNLFEEIVNKEKKIIDRGYRMSRFGIYPANIEAEYGIDGAIDTLLDKSEPFETVIHNAIFHKVRFSDKISRNNGAINFEIKDGVLKSEKFVEFSDNFDVPKNVVVVGGVHDESIFNIKDLESYFSLDKAEEKSVAIKISSENFDKNDILKRIENLEKIVQGFLENQKKNTVVPMDLRPRRGRPVKS